MTLDDTAPINVTGSVDANTIIGNAGANVLEGGNGNDTLVGGQGDDHFYGGTTSSDAGIDTVDYSQESGGERSPSISARVRRPIRSERTTHCPASRTSSVRRRLTS